MASAPPWGFRPSASDPGRPMSASVEVHENPGQVLSGEPTKRV